MAIIFMLQFAKILFLFEIGKKDENRVETHCNVSLRYVVVGRCIVETDNYPSLLYLSV